MTTLSESLIQLKNRQSELADVLTNHGVPTNDSETLYDQIQKVKALEIGTGGDKCICDTWTPHPDWWDIQSIVEGTYNEDFGAFTAEDIKMLFDDGFIRYAYVVSDAIRTISLVSQIPGEIAILSDGSWYELSDSEIIHEWDFGYDKPCSDGYKTRAVLIINNMLGDVYIDHSPRNTTEPTPIPSLFVYIGNSNINYMSFSVEEYVQVGNYSIQAVVCSTKTTMGADSIPRYGFSGCNTLRHVILANGLKTIPYYGFNGCYSLHSISIPNTVTRIDTGAFNYCYGMVSFTMSNNISELVNPFNYLRGLLNMSIPVNFSLSMKILDSKYMSISSLHNIVVNYKDLSNSTTQTLNIGPINIAKLRIETITLATLKNITLA